MTINTNHWRTLEYYDPAYLLHGLRVAERATPRDAKANELATWGKRDREWRDAALFTYGIGIALGVKVGYAQEETGDYDFVTARISGTAATFCPVQLKELVPEERNPEDTIDGLLRKLSKYDETSTVLAMKLNRVGQVDLDRAWPRIPFAELWLFWASKPDASEWSIYGDALGTPRQWAFDYPTSSGPPSWVASMPDATSAPP